MRRFGFTGGISSRIGGRGVTLGADGATIETVDQLDVIREAGISRGQGYLLARAAPELSADAIDIERVVDSHHARRQALLGNWGSSPAV